MNFLLKTKRILAFAWPVVISILCLMPSSEIPEVNIAVPHFDKIVHFGLFFILGYVWSNSIGFWHLNLSAGLLIIGIMLGGLIELVQYSLINDRSGDVFDWLADVLGLFAGTIFFRFFPIEIKKT